MKNKSKFFSVEESTFSLSISDLMSALLLIFILLLSGTLLKLAEQQELNQAQLELISEQQKAKRSIIDQLKGEMDEFDIEVDPKTGVIRIKDSILFQFGKSDLTDEGINFLNRFIPKYANILLSKKEIKEQIGQIIIEGHTDNVGSYAKNLHLSLERANSVASLIFQNSFTEFKEKNDFQKKLSANGRSFINPIIDNKTEEHRAQNRRVEFKFSFVDWTTIESEKIEKRLDNERFE